MSLRVVGPCPGHPDLQRCATSLGRGCVPAELLTRIGARLDDPDALLASTVLAGIRPVAMTLSSPGREPTSIRAIGRSWTWAESNSGPELESSSVDAWLEHLSRAGQRYQWPDERTATAADELARRLVGRRDAPPLTIALTRADGTEQVIRIYRAPPSLTSDGPYLARRDREPGFLILDGKPHTDALLPVHPMRFQRQQLINAEPFALRSVTVERAGVVETRLQRGQLLDDWRVETPPGERVQTDTIDGLRELARLRARSFAGERVAPAHGLRPATVTARLRFDPGPFADDDTPREHVIAVGARTKDGCYARLDDAGPVFTLDRATCELLTRPLTRTSSRPAEEEAP